MLIVLYMRFRVDRDRTRVEVVQWKNTQVHTAAFWIPDLARIPNGKTPRILDLGFWILG